MYALPLRHITISSTRSWIQKTGPARETKRVKLTVVVWIASGVPLLSSAGAVSGPVATRGAAGGAGMWALADMSRLAMLKTGLDVDGVGGGAERACAPGRGTGAAVEADALDGEDARGVAHGGRSTYSNWLMTDVCGPCTVKSAS